MKSILFVLLALILLRGSAAQAVEEVMPHFGVASRLAQSEAFVSPFQVIIDQRGQLTVETNPVFSEGAKDPQLELPRLLTNPKSIPLPGWALDQKGEREVTLAVAVKTDGTVGEIMVMKSSGNESLDQRVSELARHWQFRPAMRDGRAVYECIQIPILIRLEQAEV